MERKRTEMIAALGVTVVEMVDAMPALSRDDINLLEDRIQARATQEPEPQAAREQNGAASGDDVEEESDDSSFVASSSNRSSTEGDASSVASSNSTVELDRNDDPAGQARVRPVTSVISSVRPTPRAAPYCRASRPSGRSGPTAGASNARSGTSAGASSARTSSQSLPGIERTIETIPGTVNGVRVNAIRERTRFDFNALSASSASGTVTMQTRQTHMRIGWTSHGAVRMSWPTSVVPPSPHARSRFESAAESQFALSSRSLPRTAYIGLRCILICSIIL
ncbi:hypothetical protein QFC22_001160 [Naganishia vaughanmartiniae]|uniref:Uncharacterized protein n=1 Tax=Naganishia vaughanmartiniae TaxID=1424756 RepID=A0ACC2XK17_9TREE|nr:hypothetical protein QFC22_001160 [Naganishia vaughanmartiniae]